MFKNFTEYKSENFRDLSIYEIIIRLAKCRGNLDELRKLMPIQEVKEFLDDNIYKIDNIGIEITRDIA